MKKAMLLVSAMLIAGLIGTSAMAHDLQVKKETKKETVSLEKKKVDAPAKKKGKKAAKKETKKATSSK